MNKKLFGTDGIRCNVKNEIFNNFNAYAGKSSKHANKTKI